MQKDVDRITMKTMLCDDGLLKVEHEEELGVNQTEIYII